MDMRAEATKEYLEKDHWGKKATSPETEGRQIPEANNTSSTSTSASTTSNAGTQNSQNTSTRPTRRDNNEPKTPGNTTKNGYNLDVPYALLVCLLFLLCAPSIV